MLRTGIQKLVRPAGRLGVQRMNASSYIKPTNIWKIWTSDVGAYPVMVVIGFAGGFCTWWNWRLFTKQPRIAWSKSRRAEVFKETELDSTKYYNHRLREMGKKHHKKMMAECIVE
ncbi:hypothetical protein AAMO2058_000041500 [Amorphochlora amoebiformis]|mmetsp:Transcript_11655/g.18471  ORF Transcript_11655/g.18471 Transcript_11655/m.18471 type:complete len:115 (-) Transcript_11655:190-534(-)